MADAVILAKKESIDRCIRRIEEDYIGFEEDFKVNFMRQDAVILNLQRACEQIIDLANHLIRINKLTVPKNSRDAFRELSAANVLPDTLAQSLERMVGFRNIADHEYQKLNLAIVASILENNLNDLRKFIEVAVAQI